MTPQNQTIRFAAEQNYDAFFEAELPLRQLRGCPPYRDLLTVTFHGREEERVWQAALAFRARLDGLLHSEFYRGETAAVLGPAPASVARINYHYRCRLTLTASIRDGCGSFWRFWCGNSQRIAASGASARLWMSTAENKGESRWH